MLNQRDVIDEVNLIKLADLSEIQRDSLNKMHINFDLIKTSDFGNQA